MNRTNIEYLDFTWNPIVGCSGLGCSVARNCWAYYQAKRQKPQPSGRGCALCYAFVPHVHWERFKQPELRKKPSRIGVAFMGDFYDEGISDWVRVAIKMRMDNASWHKFLVLTKQPLNIEMEEDNPVNMAVGVTVNRKQDAWRINALRDVDALFHVVSFEPLYEDVGNINLTDVDWVIIGAQTRPNIQPKKEWVDGLTSLASSYEIPVFHKDNLIVEKRLCEYPSSWGFN